jgi:3',5'-cyclic AMP phosphodiesterase CpdA
VPGVRLLHLTDTHIVGLEEDGPLPSSFAGAVAMVQGRTTTDALRAVLDRVASTGFTPDLVVHTGDLVDDADPASYDAAAAALAALGAPLLVVAGNHDDRDALASRFGGVIAFEREGWLVRILDSSVDGDDDGEIGDDALYALDAELTATNADHVLLALHHPPLSPCRDKDCGLRDGAQLLDVLDRHDNVRAVLSGHLHRSDEIRRRGVDYLLSPSTAIQLVHRHPLPLHNRTQTPVGARLVDLHRDGSITTDVVWV